MKKRDELNKSMMVQALGLRVPVLLYLFAFVFGVCTSCVRTKTLSSVTYELSCQSANDMVCFETEDYLIQLNEGMVHNYVANRAKSDSLLNYLINTDTIKTDYPGAGPLMETCLLSMLKQNADIVILDKQDLSCVPEVVWREERTVVRKRRYMRWSESISTKRKKREIISVIMKVS